MAIHHCYLQIHWLSITQHIVGTPKIHQKTVADDRSQKRCLLCPKKLWPLFLEAVAVFFPKNTPRFCQNPRSVFFFPKRGVSFFGWEKVLFFFLLALQARVFVGIRPASFKNTSKSDFSSKHTVDVRNPANQLRLVVYPMIFGVLATIPGGCFRISGPSKIINL